jgi:probable rRNA maturation factor
VKLALDLQCATTVSELPAPGDFRRWTEAALTGRRAEAELSIRLVDEAESRELNRHYRGKDRPTNVLSFPADLPPVVRSPLLGDLVICAPLVAQEAREQDKEPLHHWAHLVVHGVLHLVGYDHQNETEAATMEAAEREILAGIGLPDPYQQENNE